MHERCLMLRPRTRTSSPRAGRDGGTRCTTSCRVPATRRAENSVCPCPSCTSTREGETETTLRTARALRPRPTGRWSRGTANRPRPPAMINVQSGLVAGG